MKPTLTNRFRVPKMIPGGGSLQLSNQEQLSQTGEAASRGGTSSGGFRLSPIVTVATGGSRATSSPDAGGSLPSWVWIAALGVAALYVLNRRKG